MSQLNGIQTTEAVMYNPYIYTFPKLVDASRDSTTTVSYKYIAPC